MKRILTTLLILCLYWTASAWGNSGHMTSGAITYYYLKEHNPDVIKKILKTLENHPWYNAAEWNDKLAGLTAEEKEIALFMLASTFPDEARKSPDLGGGEKTKWHYIDYPFVPEGESVKGEQPQSPNAEEKLNELFASFKGEAESSQKAQDLCWLFHLIQDIHQPLHTVSLFDANHPRGDKGGNDTYILLKEGNEPVKLHSYWDRLPTGTFKNIPAKADALLHKDEYQESKLSELNTNKTVHAWITKESVSIAIHDVYLNGNVKGTKDNPTPLDQSYIDSAKKIAERRIVLSGIRLAQELILLYS